MDNKDIILKIAREHVLKHGKMVNYGSGHVVKELEYEGHLIEISIGGYYETIWIDKCRVDL
jgi:hypothetical protein